MRTLFLRLFFVVFVLTNLSGCAFLFVGAAAGTAIVLVDRRPVGVVTVDRGLQIQIDSMLANNFVKLAHVNVNTYNQKVLLTGEATNQQIKQQIEGLVAGIKNVRVLVNEIQVAPLSSASARVADSSLLAIVKAKLLSTTDIPSGSIKVTVEAGKVYLLGITTDLEAKAAATVVSKASNSVKEVVTLFDLISEDEKQQLIREKQNDKTTAK